MTVLANTNPTLLDLANRTGPDGRISKDIVELLMQSNEILPDASWVECNDGSGHKVPIRTGIPQGTWRKLYQGANQAKSTTAMVRDACGMHEMYSTIDAALARLSGGSAEWFMSENAPFIEGMNQGVAKTLFMGDTTVDPEKFMGLAPRYATSVAANAESAANVIKGGGSGADNTEIWIIGWHPTTVTMLYPKGSTAGLQTTNLTPDKTTTVNDANGNPFEAYRWHYQWDCGLCVRDWRYVVRIPNIDVSDLTKNASAGADLVDLIVQGLETLPTGASMTRQAIYCNGTIRSFLRRQMNNKANALLSLDEIGGKRVLSFDGVPVRRVDQITNSMPLVP